ncbi:hypothetical protein BSKO_06486 [Bryopsis sp. KO-2023]|nr:hypothetical protein BSKO_06486 [Bryopsis sp. KO-2023]
MSCERKLEALRDCARKHPRDHKTICKHLHVAAGFCVFGQLCPEEVDGLLECSGRGSQGLNLRSVPARCQKYLDRLDGCIQGHQEAAQERADRIFFSSCFLFFPTGGRSISAMTRSGPRTPNKQNGEKKIDILKLSNGGSHEGGNHAKPQKGIRDELGNMVLLVVLYCLQGVPMGLSSGAMPFLLQARTSYTNIGLFSLASYPYSFKLLWSPIVDSVYSRSFGRRKTWIVPIQLMSALIMITFADHAEATLKRADVFGLTLLFAVLILLAATQDIAVDGWALTLLSKEHVGYASTCQTIGMNIGYFTSFTVFLALNDREFCNKHLRVQPAGEGIVTLASYLRFWGWVYALVTAFLLWKREGKSEDDWDMSNSSTNGKKKPKTTEIYNAYMQLWRVVRLPSVRQFALILVTYRLGVLAAESATPLKLLEKGVSKEALAGLVLLEFPMELVSALLAGRWAATSTPFTPWIFGYHIRLVMAALVTYLAYLFPPGASNLSEHPAEFLVLALFGVVTSFTATLMFTAQGSFCNKISDPDMGGAYLTLLNTIANMGFLLPKVLIYWLMDVLTVRHCLAPTGEMWDFQCPTKKELALGPNACTEMGGECIVASDGFYKISYCMVLIGFVLGQSFWRTLPRLQALPARMWHAKRGGKSS